MCDYDRLKLINFVYDELKAYKVLLEAALQTTNKVPQTNLPNKDNYKRMVLMAYVSHEIKRKCLAS